MEFIIGCILGIVLAFTYASVSIEEKDMVMFQKVCEKNDGFEKIRLDVIGYGNAYCKDGAKFSLKGKIKNENT